MFRPYDILHSVRHPDGLYILVLEQTTEVEDWRLTVRVTTATGGFSGLEVACWLLVPKFAGSNPAEAVEFFRAKKSSARLPSEEK